MPVGANTRFKVAVEEGPAHGDLYELEQTTFFRVIDTRTGAVVLAYEGEMSARYDGVIWGDRRHSGVRDITLAPDERSVCIRYHDGREERVVLPDG